jgi:putative SOS response-associated peptidase YedK
MCGRTALFAPRADLEDRFDASVPDAYRPRYNVAPGSPLEVVTSESADAVERLHWGLRPTWADADHDGFINARSETAHEKPSFRDAWASRPCLVLSSGFYEWAGARGAKQPYRIHRPETVAFAMAGLWEPPRERDDAGSVTILTTDANAVVEPIHDRMPVVLPRDAEREWLGADPDARRELCRPAATDDLDAYPIGTAVNDPGNDSPAVIDPAETEQSGLGEFG